MARAKREREAPSVPAKSITTWDTLADLIAGVAGPRPRGSVTAQEVAARTGLSRCYCASRLNARVAAGELIAIDYLTEDRKRGRCYVRARGRH